jgi:hypothetical protein
MPPHLYIVKPDRQQKRRDAANAARAAAKTFRDLAAALDDPSYPLERVVEVAEEHYETCVDIIWHVDEELLAARRVAR